MSVAVDSALHLRKTHSFEDDNKPIHFNTDSSTHSTTTLISEPNTTEIPVNGLPQVQLAQMVPLPLSAEELNFSPQFKEEITQDQPGKLVDQLVANTPPVNVQEKPEEKIQKDTSSVSSSGSSQPPKKSLLRTTVVRSIVGILMMIFFYLVLQLQHEYIAVLIVVAQMVTWNEVVSIRHKIEKEKKIKLFRTINWYFLFVSLLFFYGEHALRFTMKWGGQIAKFSQLVLEYSLPIIFFLYVAGFVAFILSLRKNILRYQFSQLTWTILTLLLIVGQTHFSMQYLFDGIIWILLPHSMSIVNDIMAYFCGITLGRKIIDRPLFALSPNKTWEGFIGAMCFTIAFAFFVSPLFLQSDWLICPAGLYNPVFGCDTSKFSHGYIFSLAKYNVPILTSDFTWSTFEISLYPLQLHAISFALFSSLIAPFGGFLASSIKRAFNKKDFDNIFPGHGGFMDRVDCQLLMCTFVFIYLNTFIKGRATTVDSILSQIRILTRDEQFRLLESLQTLINKN